MNRIIAFTGAHGTGKTTAAMEEAARIRREYPRQTVGLVLDIERRCPYPVNRKGTDKAQAWIFSHQLAAEQEALARYNLVVSDRTLMDVVAYTRVLGFDDLARRMLVFAEGYMSTYRLITFNFIKDNDFLIDDGFRDISRSWRQKIEDVLLTYYFKTGVADRHNFSAPAIAN